MTAPASSPEIITRWLHHEQQRLLERLARGISFADLSHEIVATIERHEPTISALVMQAREQRLWVVAAPALPEIIRVAIHGCWIRNDGSCCSRAAYRMTRVALRDVADEPLWPAMPAELGVRACWAQPILGGARREAFGVLALCPHQRGLPTPEQEALLETFANLLALAIERERSVASLRERESFFRQLFESNQAIKLLIDPEDGAIVDANAAAACFYGYPVDRLRRLKIGEINVTPADQLACFLEEALTQRTRHFHCQHRLADGELRDVEVYSGPARFGERTLLYSIIHDITDRKQMEQALRRSEMMLAEAQRIAYLGSWEWDIVHDRMAISLEVFRIFGMEPGSVAPTTTLFLNFIHPDDRQRFLDGMKLAIKSGAPLRLEYRIVLGDGTIRHIHEKAEIERDASGRAIRMFGMLQNITYRVQAEEQLRRALAEAQQAEQAKSRFLATMSHEIRTPLNGILGLTDLLLDTPLNQMQRDYLQTVHDSGETLLTILNDILDFSLLNAEKLRLKQEPLDPAQLVVQIVRLFTGFAREHDLSLDWHLPEIGDLRVLADGDRLRQVLMNLVSNALKFTEQGGVTLSLEVVARQEQSARLLFDVQDSGIGISEEHKSLLFQEFSRLDNDLTRRRGGTGLGLVICRKLLALMGAELLFDSQPGVGSRFWFELTLPLARCEMQPVAVTPTKDDLFTGRVLLVEDTPTSLLVAQGLLTALGVSVTPAESGEEALLCIEQLPRFDLIFMDIQMPGMDGYETSVAIRQFEQSLDWPEVPIVALTAHTSPGSQAGVAAANIVEHLTKPVTRAMLRQSLSRWLPNNHNHALEQQRREAESAAPDPTRLWHPLPELHRPGSAAIR